jgi:protoheme IX farnesyltransferase
MKSDERSGSTWFVVRSRLDAYWKLIKSLQTGLLLMTGLAGYVSAQASVHWGSLWQLGISLFLAISGSTILNMWWDRDLDARMKRTHMRPAAAGSVRSVEVVALGLVTSAIGVGWAARLNIHYGLAVFAGWFFDVVVYSVWLKRRTCWAIVWGGSRARCRSWRARSAIDRGHDWHSLAAPVLPWIPRTRDVQSPMDDYRAAGVPTFPSTYGIGFTCLMIAAQASSLQIPRPLRLCGSARPRESWL